MLPLEDIELVVDRYRSSIQSQNVASFGCLRLEWQALQGCTELVQTLDLPRNRDDDARELFRQFMSANGAGRWLFILNNADSDKGFHEPD